MVKLVEVKVQNEAGILPQIEEIKLMAHDRETGYKAVVNTSNMETICVVPQDNAIVQHQHVYDEVQKLENYVMKDVRLMKGGQVLMIELMERTPRQIELMPDDMLECGARIFNDYGKNRGLTVQGYGVRLVCTNGVTAPQSGSKIQIEAFGTADFAKEIEEKIESALNAWANVSDLFVEAQSTVVSVKDIATEIEHLLPKKYMKTVFEHLREQESLYNVWNELTRTITHDMGVKINKKGEVSLQQKVNKVLTIKVETQ